MGVEKDTVIKSAVDKRQYRIVHLDNGLTAALIHDPDVLSEKDKDVSLLLSRRKSIKSAAASMCVGVGCFYDPVDAPGLPHFLEHMLDMGSSEFPDENEYHVHIENNGGSFNAYTEGEYTTYFLTVNGDALKPALKRFSQQFISPLVNAEAMQREIKSITSEFNNKMEDDDCRIQMLQWSSTVAGHALRKRNGGNIKTLMPEGVDTRAKVLDVFNNFYVAGNMKLTVIGGDSLETLEEWIVDLFSNVKRGEVERLSFETHGAVWEGGRIFWVQPIEHVQYLFVTWSLPSLHREYLTKPEKYLQYILCNRGAGSLLSLFKRKGLATSVRFRDFYDQEVSVNYIFQLKIGLTDLGVKDVLKVIGILYQYMKLMRDTGPQKWVFEELQTIAKLEFMYPREYWHDDYAYGNYACNLSRNLFTYPEKHILYERYAFEIWDPAFISRRLSFLNPHNMRIDVVTKSFICASSDVQYEQWYGTPYVITNIPAPLLMAWENPNFIDPFLSLPKKSDYIPRDLVIPDSSSSRCKDKFKVPKCLVTEGMLKIWCKHHNIPRARAWFMIKPYKVAMLGTLEEVKEIVIFRLYVELLRDTLEEILAQWDVCKIKVDILDDETSYSLLICGFSEKITVLALNILKGIKLFKPAEDRFKMIRGCIEREYRDHKMHKRLHCLLCLSFPYFDIVSSYLRHNAYIEGLCYGKLSKTDIIHIADAVKDTFPPCSPRKRDFHTEALLPMGSKKINDCLLENDYDVNSSVDVYFQIGRDRPKTRAIADFFDHIFSPAFYSQLRVKEQLGYEVRSGVRTDSSCHAVGFAFVVKSWENSPSYSEKRILEFIDELVPRILRDMKSEEFQILKKQLLAKHLKKKISFKRQFDLYCNEILHGTYLFRSHQLETNALKRVRQSDLLQWYNSYLNNRSSQCTRITTRTWASSSFPSMLELYCRLHQEMNIKVNHKN